MGETQWIMCSICGSKTRLRIRYDTVLDNFRCIVSNVNRKH